MSADKPAELLRIKLKTWTRQPVPMISKHSAHSTSLPVGFGTWLWRYTCLLLLISMLWHRQAIFESKGDKLSSSAEGRIRTQGLRYLFTNRLNACWQTDWAIEDQAKNLNSTARPYDQQAFSPLDLTASWLSHLALRYTCLLLLISMLWHSRRYSNHKETSCLPLLKAGFEPKVSDTYSPADWMPADIPTELSRIKLKTWTRQPVPMISKHSAHSTSLPVGFRTWLWRYTCLLLLISMLWHRQAIFESKGDKLSSSAEGRIRIQGLRYLFTSRLNACWQTDWAIEDQAKNLNSTARTYDQQAFSPLDLTASWLWHLALAIYMFVVVNFDALAQASDIRI